MNKTQELVKLCRSMDSSEPSEEVKKVTEDFLKELSENSIQSIPAEAINSLFDLPPFGASWLAFTFGAAIESGIPPEASGKAVFSLLNNWLREFPVIDEESEEMPELNGKQSLYIDALPLLCRSVVSHVAKTPDFRETLSKDADLIARLKNVEIFTHAATWVRELLEKHSGTLLVIHVMSQKAIQLRYENVSNCFHLFSLIQTIISDKLPGGKKPSRKIYESARCQYDAHVNDQAWWHYGHPLVPEPDIGGSIWGEGNVQQIPFIDNTQVILLWSKILKSRSWDSGFFGPRIDAALPNIEIIRKLNTDEIDNWFNKLNLNISNLKKDAKLATEKPWWRFW